MVSPKRAIRVIRFDATPLSRPKPTALPNRVLMRSSSLSLCCPSCLFEAHNRSWTMTSDETIAKDRDRAASQRRRR
jgi:hypothetical protein